MRASESPAQTRALLALLAVLGVLGSVRLGQPYDGHREAALAMYSTFGRNYARFGYGAAAGAPIEASGPSLEPYDGAAGAVYSHRPPVVSLLVSMPIRLFGHREWVLRATLLITALGVVTLFSRIALRILGAPWHLVATAFFGGVPIFAYYAVTTVHQVFALLGILLIYLFHLRWREQPTRRRFVELLAVATACTWLDWPVFYAVGAIALLEALPGAPCRRLAPLLFVVPVAIGLGGFLGYLHLLDPEGGAPWRNFWASGAGHRGAPPGGAAGYLVGEARELALHFTLPLLVLAAVGTARLRPRSRPGDAAVLSMLLLGSDEVLFPSMCGWHDYLTLPLVPFVALTAAAAIRGLAARPRGLAIAAALLLGVAVQSGAVLWRRWTFRGYHAVEVEVARAIGRTTRPDDRVLVRANLDPFLFSYYADRCYGKYAEACRNLSRGYVPPAEAELEAEVLLGRMLGPSPGYTVFVTVDAVEAAARHPWVRGLSPPEGADAFVDRWYGFETSSRPTPLLRGLAARYPAHRSEGLHLVRLAP